jgi:hypothetical protein
MNYYLSVIPYFGAVEAGVAPKIALTNNPDSKVFLFILIIICLLFIILYFIFYINILLTSCPYFKVCF